MPPMEVDSDSAHAASNVDNWLTRFSPSGPFPFTPRKVHAIESRRACMADLLIFDVLLVRGGIRNPDMLFPPADWMALGKLLDTIDQSVYDILKKDCLVYILLKWAWDADAKEANPGWDVRYLQDRCIAPQFAALANAYWLLDTGTHLAKAVSILSDVRLNRDYVSKILQALALSASPASFASGTASATAALVVKYVRTAKPLLTEPDDIDLYALSLAQSSFMDAWAYQKSFPEESDTRERLLRKLVGWCLTPAPKQEPLAQLLAFPLSTYEQSTLHTLALPSQLSASSSLSSIDLQTTAAPSGPVLSSQAMSVLQDLLCVRAIQSGDYVGAIKLDRRFSSLSPSFGVGTFPSSTSQTSSSGRDTIDRKSIMQDLFATLPPAERTLLEDEIGKVATGVRANMSSTPRQVAPATKRPLVAESSLSASWEDVGAAMGSPAPSASLSSSLAGTSFAGNATPPPVSATSKISQSPFVTRVARPPPTSGHQLPPTPKFTAFGSPIPSPMGVSAGRGVITERSKTLFSTGATSGSSTIAQPATRVSLFETAGSAKNAPNAFFKPPSAKASLDAGNALTSFNVVKNAQQSTYTPTQNETVRGGDTDGEDVSMESGSDVEDVEEGHEARQKEHDEEARVGHSEDDTENFITDDKSGAADLTLHTHDVDELMSEDDGFGPDLGFSVFSGTKSAVQNGNTNGPRKGTVSGNGHAPPVSLSSHAHVSPPCKGDESLSASINSASSKQHAPPGAFHHEDEEEIERDQGGGSDEEGDEDEADRVSQTTPAYSPRRSARTKTHPQTPPHASTRSQPQRSSKSVTVGTGSASRLSIHTRRTSSNRPRPSQTIPGALMDEDHDDQGHDTDHTDPHGDDDVEFGVRQEEEEDAIAPLPARASRRTRSAAFVASMSTSNSSAKSAKPSTTAPPAKGKAKTRPSEVKTPARRSSRLSMASLSPDHTEAASPTKKGRKSSGSRASIAGSGSGTVPIRSSTRRKR